MLHALGAWHSDHQHCCKVFRAMSRRGVLQQVTADHIFGILPQKESNNDDFWKEWLDLLIIVLDQQVQKNVFTIGKKNNWSRLPLFLVVEMDTHRIWQLTWLINPQQNLAASVPKGQIIRQGQLFIERFENRCHSPCLPSGGQLHHRVFHHQCIKIIKRFPVLFIINVINFPLLIYLLPLHITKHETHS